MPLTGEDLPANPPGTNPSLDFGQATQFQADRKELESVGSPAGAQPGPGGSPMGPAPTPAAPPGPPVQPTPPQGERQTVTPDLLRPGGPVFSAPQLSPQYPWRDELGVWASHPRAGPVLGNLQRRIAAERATALQQGPRQNNANAQS